MSILQGRYGAPGVYTETIPGPVIGTNLDTTSVLGLVGTSRGRLNTSEDVLVAKAGTPSAPLSIKAAEESTVVVRDATTGRTFAKTTDYTVAKNGEGYITITAASGGELPVGGNVRVSYEYTIDTYYEPRYFFDADDLQEFYGPAFNADGTVGSELSLAGQIAFINGATVILTAAVKTPSTPQAYADALSGLTAYQEVSVVAVANGNSSIHTFVRSHVNRAASQGSERRAVVGFDGATGNRVASEQRRSAAQSMNDPRVAMVSPDRVLYNNPTTGQPVLIGGHFLAVAVAAVSTTLGPAMPLTRKQVDGFYGLQDISPAQEKDLEAQAGLMVLEPVRTSGIRVRHGVTTKPGDVVTREWSIVGQQDTLAKSIRQSLDNDRLIGGIIDDLTLANVKASVDTALQGLMQTGAINDYGDVKVRQVPATPDVVEVRFTWKPSVPLNYIAVRYAITLDTGETTTIQE